MRKPKHPEALCETCTLYDRPYCPSHVPASAKVVFIGEGPGANEVKDQRPFTGMSGKLLESVLHREGMSTDECHLTNAVLCRPPNNRTPTTHEVRCCGTRLINEVSRSPAKTVITLGKSGADALGVPDLKPSKKRGVWFDMLNKDVMPTWHPAYVLRRPGEMYNFMNDVKRGVKGKINHTVCTPPDVKVLWTDGQLREAFDSIPEGADVVFDLETDQVVWYKVKGEPAQRILMLGIAYREDEGFIIPSSLLYGDWENGKPIGDLKDYPRAGNEYFLTEAEGLYEVYGEDITLLDGKCRNTVKEFFARKDLNFIAHNGKFDTLFLRSIGIDARVDFDTMLAHYVLWEVAGTHGLKPLATQYFGLHDYEEETILQYLRSRNDYYSKIPLEPLSQYCAWDVCVTLALKRELEQEMVDQGLFEKPFKSMIMPDATALTEVEWNGIEIDVAYVREWEERLQSFADSLEERMQNMVVDEIERQYEILNNRLAGLNLEKDEELAGKIRKRIDWLMDDIPTLNPRSFVQVSRVMFELYKLPKVRAARIDPTSTSKKAIAWIHENYPETIDHTFLKTLLTYRRLHKMLRSYLVNLLKYVGEDNRIHSTFFVHGTEVGRLSARNPALQTIPRPYEDLYGAVIRGAFTAAPGHVLIHADYSQAELRAAGVLSEEPFLIDVYKEGRDLHSEVALAMYGEKWSKAQRVLTKMFNFSYLYGGNEYSFAQDAGLPITEARQFVHDYNRVMPKLTEYKRDQLKHARRYGYVQSPFGRKRRFPLIVKENLEEVRKSSVHMPIASTASDLTQLSLMRLQSMGYKIVLTVHDSVLMEVKIEDAQEAADEAKRVMEEIGNSYFPEVPWKADADIVTRWSPYPVVADDLTAFEDFFEDDPPYRISTEHLETFPLFSKLIREQKTLLVWSNPFKEDE